MLIFIQNSVIMLISSGGHSDRLIAKIMCGAAMQKSSQDSLLASTALLDSLEESAGTSEVEPSSLLTRESASSSRMLKAIAASPSPALVKYQRGTSSPLSMCHVAMVEMMISIIVGTPLGGMGMSLDLFFFLSSLSCSSFSLSNSSCLTLSISSLSCLLSSASMAS